MYNDNLAHGGGGFLLVCSISVISTYVTSTYELRFSCHMTSLKTLDLLCHARLFVKGKANLLSYAFDNPLYTESSDFAAGLFFGARERCTSFSPVKVGASGPCSHHKNRMSIFQLGTQKAQTEFSH